MLQPDEDDDEVIFVEEVIRVRHNAGDRPPPPLLPPCPVIFDLPVRRDVARPVRAPLLITLDDEEDEVVPLENTPAAVDHETDQAEVVEGASTTDQAAAPVDEVSPSTTTISLAHSPLMTPSGSSQDIPCPWDGTLHTIHLADRTSASIYCSDACIRQHITELETYLAKMNDARMRITSRNADSFTVIHRLEHTLAEQTKSNIFEFLQAHPLYSIVKPIPLKEGLDLLNRSYSSTDSAFLKLPKNVAATTVATTNSAVNSLEDDFPVLDDHISMSPGRSSSPVREHKSKRKKKSSLSAKKKTRDSKTKKKKSKSKSEHLIASPIELPSTSKTSKRKKSTKDKQSRRSSEVVETVPAAVAAPEPDATATACSSKHLVDCAPPGKDWNAKMAGFGGSKKKTKATTEIKTTGGRDVVAKKPTKKLAKSLSTRTALSTNKTVGVGGSGIKTSKPHPVGQGVVKKSTMPATSQPSTSMNSGAGPSKSDSSRRQPLIGPDGDSLKTPTAATPPSDFFDIDDLFIPLDSLPSMPLPFPERGSLASPSIPPIQPPFHPVATSSPKKRPPPAPVDTNTDCPPPTKRPCLESRTSPQPPRTPMSLKMPPPPQSSASPHQVNDSGSALNIMGRVDAVRSPFHSAIPSPSSAFIVPGLRTEPVIIPLEAIGEGTSSAVGRPNSATFDRRLASSIPIHSGNLTLPLPPFHATLPRKTLTHSPVRGQFPHRSLPNQHAPRITNNKPAKSLSLPFSWTSRSPEEQDSPPQQPSSTIASPAATSAATPTEQDISEFLRNARHTGGITIWTGIMVNDIVDSRCQHLRRSFKVLATKLWGDWSQGYFMDANIQKHGGLIISKRVCFEEIFAILDQWQRGNVALMALKQVDGSGGEAYHELHRYLLGRQRMGVVQLTKTTELKHLFVYPLAASAPVPVPFSEMCFDLPPVNQRPDMFLALMLRLTGPSSSTNTTPRSSFSPLTSPFTPSGASPGNAPSPSLLQPQIRSPGTFSSGSPSPGSGLASFSHGGGSRLHQNANSSNNRYSRMSPRPTSSSSRQGHPSPRPPNVREEFMNLVLQGEDDVNLPLPHHLPSDQNVAITSTLNQRARRNMAPFSNGEVASGSSASNSSTTVPIGGPRQYRFVPASTSTRYTAGSNPCHGQHRQYRFQPNHHHHPVAPVQPQQRHDPRDPRLQGRPVSASPPSSSAQPVSAPRRAAH